MISIVLIIIFLLGIVTAVLLSRKKSNSCSCTGKTCKVDNDCLSPCCDTNVCINGKCCSTDCTGKNCSQTNSCGQSCDTTICGREEVCFEGNCCQPNCQPNTCSDNGCGGQCSCDTANGYTCIADSQGVRSCCKPPDCSSGYCGTTACGTCKCADEYCDPSIGCCQADRCTYTDICHKNPNFAKILGNSWAKFCKTCSFPLDHCDLISPQFYPGSFIPISGTIKCNSCKGNAINETTVIDPAASYYDYDPATNKITGNYIGNYCKDSSGKCNGTCVCIKNEDCQAHGCTTCIGGFCN